METLAFIEALTETLFISVAQAFVIVLFFRTMFNAVPGIPSQIKFNIWYSSLLLISGLFVYSLFSIYIEKLQLADYVADSAFSSRSAMSEPASWFSRLQSWESRHADSIAVCYFAGVFIHLVSILISWFKSRSWFRSEVLLKDNIWVGKLDILRKKSGIAKNVSLHVSQTIAVPITLGFFKPMILLPVSLVANLSPQQVESVLLHELAHIKRNDYLLNLFQKVMESGLFFNPFVWLIAREIRKEREYCCDEMVIAHTSDPLTYAKALLHLEEYKHSIRLALAANGSGEYPLLNRIKRITMMNNSNASQKTGLLTIITVFFVGISLALALPESKKEIEAEVFMAISQTPLLPEKPVLCPQPGESVRKQQPGTPPTARSGVPRDTSLVKKNELKKLQQQLKKATDEINKLGQQQSDYINSDDWKKHRLDMMKHADEMKKHFEGPEWKEVQMKLSEQGQIIEKQLDDPEWKNFQKNIHLNGEMLLAKNEKNISLNMRLAELNKKMIDLHEVFENPEWNSKLEDIQKSAEMLEMKFNSPEWKQKEIELERKAKQLSERLEQNLEIKQHIKKIEKKAREIERNMKSTK